MGGTRRAHGRRSVAADVVMGALAGAAATWAMGRVTTYLYEHEPRDARRSEDEARGGDTAYAAAVEKAAGAVGVEVTDEQKAAGGQALHWALGMGAGAMYGALRPRVPAAGAAGGLLFGAAFWLVTDEGAVPALGLTPGPTAFPWETHARGLAGHLVFGATADAALNALEAVA